MRIALTLAALAVAMIAGAYLSYRIGATVTKIEIHPSGQLFRWLHPAGLLAYALTFSTCVGFVAGAFLAAKAS